MRHKCDLYGWERDDCCTQRAIPGGGSGLISNSVTSNAVTVLVTDPSSIDPDGDGLDDATEVELGTDPGMADTDGDGVPDGEEVSAGTSPTDPNDYPVTGTPIWLFYQATQPSSGAKTP